MDYPICVRGSMHLQLFSLKGTVFHSLLLRIEMKESFSYCTAGNEAAAYLYGFSTTVTEKTRKFLFLEWSDGSPLCVCAGEIYLSRIHNLSTK